MFIALDGSNQRVSIDTVDKTKQYFCPVCGEKLSIKALDSLSVKAHFAHKKGTECLDTWQHDMSEWHYNWQCLFPEEFREVVVEKDGIKHRADVLINDYVIEFQHSPITATEIMERNTFYLNCGYNVIWVFDANGKIKNSFDKDGCIDPAKLKVGDLEWKRARAEFKDQICKEVSYFIEYNTNISTNPPSNSNIMLFLTELHPKEIKYLPTIFPVGDRDKYIYLIKDYFVRSFLPKKDNDNVMSALDIIKKSLYYRQSLQQAPLQLRPRYTVGNSQSRRKSRF